MSAEEADNDFFRYRSPLDFQPTENNSETMRNAARNTRNAELIVEDIADADEMPPEFHMPAEVQKDLPMPSSDADSQPAPDLNQVEAKPSEAQESPTQDMSVENEPVFKTSRTAPVEEADKIDFGQRKSRINFQPTAEDVVEAKPESPKAAPVEAYLGEVIPGNEPEKASAEKKDERIAFRERAAAARAENRARCKKGPRAGLGSHKP
jgi:hypothetical protein